jgi:hypothetical protein
MKLKIPCQNQLHLVEINEENLKVVLHSHQSQADKIIDSLSSKGHKCKEFQSLIENDNRKTHHNYIRNLLEFLEFSHKELVSLACGFAERTLPLFEQQFPEDSRPRDAIQAARNWIENPTEETEENRNAASAAGNAAYAAGRAAFAARHAAWAAGRAAFAAGRAAFAARHATYAAEHAAHAAMNTVYTAYTAREPANATEYAAYAAGDAASSAESVTGEKKWQILRILKRYKP